MTTDPLVIQLRQAREAAGMSQRELAEALGYAVGSALANKELGYSSPTLATLRPWAAALGLRVVLVPIETAPATSVVAGNGAPRLGEGPADEDAPASAPADVGSDEGRADVALDAEAAEYLAASCDCDAHRYFREQMQDPEFVAAWMRTRNARLRDSAVARTLDVAEATADKARAVGLARETAS